LTTGSIRLTNPRRGSAWDRRTSEIDRRGSAMNTRSTSPFLGADGPRINADQPFVDRNRSGCPGFSPKPLSHYRIDEDSSTTVQESRGTLAGSREPPGPLDHFSALSAEFGGTQRGCFADGPAAHTRSLGKTTEATARMSQGRPWSLCRRWLVWCASFYVEVLKKDRSKGYD